MIIVGTHYDEVLSNSKKFPPSFVDDYQQVIRGNDELELLPFDTVFDRIVSVIKRTKFIQFRFCYSFYKMNAVIETESMMPVRSCFINYLAAKRALRKTVNTVS